MADLREDFRRVFLDSLRVCKDELGYYASYVYAKLGENDGDAVATARWCLSRPASYGLYILRQHNRFDLSAEALVLDPRFHDLFTDEDRRQAQATLDALR